MFARKRAVFLLLVALAGCSRGPELASVEGTVRLDGKPLAEAEVQLIPDVTAGATGPAASAYTDRDGRYQILATGRAGVVVGKNRVCINDARAMMPGAAAADVESGAAQPGVAAPAGRRIRVPAVYSDATRSPLGVVEVRPGPQSHDFDLKSHP